MTVRRMISEVILGANSNCDSMPWEFLEVLQSCTRVLTRRFPWLRRRRGTSGDGCRSRYPGESQRQFHGSRPGRSIGAPQHDLPVTSGRATGGAPSPKGRHWPTRLMESVGRHREISAPTVRSAFSASWCSLCSRAASGTCRVLCFKWRRSPSRASSAKIN